MAMAKNDQAHSQPTSKRWTLDLPVAQPIKEFGVNAAKAAITEDDDNLSALGLLGDVRDNCIHVGQIGCVLSGSLQILHQFLGTQTLLDRELFESGHLGNQDGIGICEGVSQLRLKNISTGR